VSAFGDLVDRAAPELTARMRQARRTSPVLGMLCQPNQIRQAYGPGWALVGDAGYYRDAVTAHGISDAFRDAEILATALDRVLSGRADESTALSAYQRRRDQALREIFEITCQLSAYPPVSRFIELQKQLGIAIDKEAAELASGPDGPGAARDQLTGHQADRQGGGR
jgi:flavin-dependent dehydrogenase